MQAKDAKQQEVAEFADDWITLREAVALMHVNEKYLRKRDATGRYVYFPELARIQWAESAKIYFLRSQVMAWRRRMEQEAIARSAPAPAPVENGVSTYAPIRDELTRLGANPRLLRALGIEDARGGARSRTSR